MHSGLFQFVREEKSNCSVKLSRDGSKKSSPVDQKYINLIPKNKFRIDRRPIRGGADTIKYLCHRLQILVVFFVAKCHEICAFEKLTPWILTDCC
jgi:hypothetical protein